MAAGFPRKSPNCLQKPIQYDSYRIVCHVCHAYGKQWMFRAAAPQSQPMRALANMKPISIGDMVVHGSEIDFSQVMFDQHACFDCEARSGNGDEAWYRIKHKLSICSSLQRIRRRMLIFAANTGDVPNWQATQIHRATLPNRNEDKVSVRPSGSA